MTRTFSTLSRLGTMSGCVLFAVPRYGFKYTNSQKCGTSNWKAAYIRFAITDASAVVSRLLCFCKSHHQRMGKMLSELPASLICEFV